VVWFQRRNRVQIRVQETLALVVGYGMAALLFRAFWPTSVPATLLGLPMLALYIWLGLAMSGPIILLREGPETAESTEAQQRARPAAVRTWAEWAWILIGIYWIVLGLFVIPGRLHDFQLLDAVLYGVVPILVALAFRFLGPSSPRMGTGSRRWTHCVAIGLLATWPIAWLCLILLGMSLR
jgi:hypothetical protein